MRIRSDCSALESIPLRLMIIAVVAALSVVPAAEALETLESKDFVRRAVLQLECVISTAQVLAIEGPGSVRTVLLDFGGGGSVRFDSISIGDREGGSNMSSAILTLSSGARIVRSASDPPVCMRSPEGHAVHLETPAAKLRFSCELLNATWYVLVEVV